MKYFKPWSILDELKYQHHLQTVDIQHRARELGSLSGCISAHQQA